MSYGNFTSSGGHYTRAQALLDLAELLDADGDPQAAGLHVAEAQVHATLALAGVVALQASGSGVPEADAVEWRRIASADPAWLADSLDHGTGGGSS